MREKREKAVAYIILVILAIVFALRLCMDNICIFG